MKTKQTFLILFFFMIGIHVFCQNYPNIVNYNFNGTPTYGVKIKTNLPFQNSSQMPTIKIEGYNYNGPNSTINLNIAWYIYNNEFYLPTMSSSGGTAPNVWLSNEDGKVVIFLDQKIYCQRFTVSAFAQGMSEKTEYFQGWTVVDAALGGTNQQQVPYKNVFAGNVGIGTETPQEMLDVAGTIRAKRLNCYDLSGNTLKSVLARLEEGNNVGEGTYLGVKSYVSQKTPEYPDGKIKLFSIEHKFYGQLNSSN